jgi:hypothetical protein
MIAFLPLVPKKSIVRVVIRILSIPRLREHFRARENLACFRVSTWLHSRLPIHKTAVSCLMFLPFSILCWAMAKVWGAQHLLIKYYGSRPTDRVWREKEEARMRHSLGAPLPHRL